MRRPTDEEDILIRALREIRGPEEAFEKKVRGGYVMIGASEESRTARAALRKLRTHHNVDTES